MKRHNDKFHKDNPYGARVYAISSGPEIGKLIWTMGPTTWESLDNRPAAGAHDNDWDNNVDPLLEAEANLEYYSFDSDLSYFPDDFKLNNLFIRYVDLKPFQNYCYTELVKKVKKVYEDKLPDESYGIYWNNLGDSKN